MLKNQKLNLKNETQKPQNQNIGTSQKSYSDYMIRDWSKFLGGMYMTQNSTGYSESFSLA